MMGSQFLSWVVTRLPCLLLGVWRDFQSPLLHRCLLRPALSFMSICAVGASVGSSELFLAGLGLPAIAGSGSGLQFIWAVVILIGPQISSILVISRVLFVVFTFICPLVVILSSIVVPGSMESALSVILLLRGILGQISVPVVVLILVSLYSIPANQRFSISSAALLRI